MEKECECIMIVKEIHAKYPNCDWNMDAACKEWEKKSEKLKANHISYPDHSDECYACCCPTCGRIVCGWCV